MKDYAIRKADRERHGARRFRYFTNPNDLDRTISRAKQTHGRGFYEEPSYWFCLQDFRLLIMWWTLRMYGFKRRYEWALDQHGCSCWLCTMDKRKWRGNSWIAMPIQERREDLATVGDRRGFEELYRDEAQEARDWVSAYDTVFEPEDEFRQEKLDLIEWGQFRYDVGLWDSWPARKGVRSREMGFTIGERLYRQLRPLRDALAPAS